MISVIVPVHNGMPWLEEQLQALIDQECSEPWEIVVADNGSTDESRSVVQGWAARFQKIRLVDAPLVRGPGAARNVGAGAARGELLAFCDADDVVQPGWLAGHVAALARVDFSGGVFDSWSLNGRPVPSPLLYARPSAVSQFGFLPAVTSNNLALRRTAFERVGGFAEDLMTGEDIDLSWRLQLAGLSCVVTADSVVARRDRSGFWKVLRRFIAYGKCGPALYRRYRADGLRRNMTVAGKTWIWLVLMTPRLVQSDFRVQWAGIAGWRIGRVLGSLQQGVLFL